MGIRESKEDYKIVNVEDWIKYDEVLEDNIKKYTEEGCNREN